MSAESDPYKTAIVPPFLTSRSDANDNPAKGIEPDVTTAWCDGWTLGAVVLFLFSILKMIGVFDVAPTWVKTVHEWAVIGLFSAAGLGLAKRLKIDGYLAFAFITFMLFDFWYRLTPNEITNIQVPATTASGFFISAALLSCIFALRTAPTFAKQVSRFGHAFTMITVAASTIILCFQPFVRSPTEIVHSGDCVIVGKTLTCPEKQ